MDILRRSPSRPLSPSAGWSPLALAAWSGALDVADRLLSMNPVRDAVKGPVVAQATGDAVRAAVAVGQGAPRAPGEARLRVMVEPPLEPGERLVCVGGCPALGSWDTRAGLELVAEPDGSGYHSAWAALPAAEPISLRLAVLAKDGWVKSVEANRAGRAVSLAGVAPAHAAAGASHLAIDLGRLLPVKPGPLRPGESLLHVTALEDGSTLPLFSRVELFVDGRPRGVMTGWATAIAVEPPTVVALPDQGGQRQLRLDVYSAEGLLAGRALVPPEHFAAKYGILSLPVVTPDALAVVGLLSVEYLVVEAYRPSVLADEGPGAGAWARVLPDTQWAPRRLFGHRGYGADLKSVRAHVKENTVPAFLAGALAGAEAVELDVMLSKDGVAVINHNFSVATAVGGARLHVPVDRLTSKDIQSIYEHDSAGALAGKMRLPGSQREGYVPLKRKLFRSLSAEHATAPDPAAAAGAPAAGAPSTPTHPIPLPSPIFSPAGPSSTPSAGDEHMPSPAQVAHTVSAEPSTLEDVLRSLPASVGVNVEVKYPDPGLESVLYVVQERNILLNTVLEIILTTGPAREIVFSSFDPSVCLLLQAKQCRFPVLFLTCGGNERYPDPRKDSLRGATAFAKHHGLFGICTNGRPIVQSPALATVVRSKGLALFTYGINNNIPDMVRLQHKVGVDVVIADHIPLIKKATFLVKS
jgi:glycerophosphoryl diester phosphodiesterase